MTSHEENAANSPGKTTNLNTFFTEKLLSTGYDGVLRYYRKVCGISVMCLVPEYMHISTQKNMGSTSSPVCHQQDKSSHELCLEMVPSRTQDIILQSIKSPSPLGPLLWSAEIKTLWWRYLEREGVYIL